MRSEAKRVLVVALLALAGAGLVPARSAEQSPQVVEEFFAALNSDDPAALSRFAERGMSDGFKARRTAEENQSFYDRLRRDLGRVSVASIEVTSPDRAVVRASAEKIPMPVTFGFDLLDGRIDGMSVRIGGPPAERSGLLELPPFADLEAFRSALDSRLGALTDADRFSGVVLLARAGEPVFHRAYGLANRASGIPNEVSTRFDVGSITKLVTRVAVAQLAQGGELSLGDTILEHLPSYPAPDVARRITIEHLLDHSSGLGDIFNERWAAAERSKFSAPADFFELFVRDPLLFEPGTRRSYSNAGFIVLGAIVEAAAGMPYFTFVEKRIFEPADMERSGFLRRDGSLPDVAIGYTRGGPTGGDVRAAGELRANLGMLPALGCPAGSSSHTAEDLLKLDRALRSGALLDEKWTAWVFGSDEPRDDAGYSIGVAGGGPGVSAGLESDGRTTVIVLANLDPPSGSELAAELFRAVSDAPAE